MIHAFLNGLLLTIIILGMVFTFIVTFANDDHEDPTQQLPDEHEEPQKNLSENRMKDVIYLNGKPIDKYGNPIRTLPGNTWKPR